MLANQLQDSNPRIDIGRRPFREAAAEQGKLKGIEKLFGLVILAGLLDTQKFNLGYLNSEAMALYFGQETYRDYHKAIQAYWGISKSLSIVASFFILKKVKPLYHYAAITLTLTLTQVICVFLGPKDMVVFGVLVGVVGGYAAGSVLIIPLHYVWRLFEPRFKVILVGLYFMVTMLIRDSFLYPILRRLWWGKNNLDDPSEIEKFVKE